MLPLLVATAAQLLALVAIGQLFMIGRVRIVATDAVHELASLGIHVWALTHAVQVRLQNFLVASQAELLHVGIQKFGPIAGVG